MALSPSLLESLGWTAELDAALAASPFIAADPTLVPARVVVQQRGRWLTVGPAGELSADIRGRLRRRGVANIELPAVGDWVLVAPRPYEGRATIAAVLPRRSALVRKVAGQVTEAQVVAANVDVVLVTVPLDSDINVRRVERQLTSVWESGATPVIVATKSDRQGSRDISELQAAALGVEVIVLSALTGDGVAQLQPWLGAGTTLALLGPSGAGKSTLTNALLGEERMATGGVREGDAKGRHTTSHRELVVLPGGAMLIDTPGLRELALWDADEGLAATFTDIEELAAQCRFANCTHGNEPQCAIRAALADGTLDVVRLDAWRKLESELAHLARKQDVRSAAEEKRKLAILVRDSHARNRQ